LNTDNPQQGEDAGTSEQDCESDVTTNHEELTLLASEPLDPIELDHIFGSSPEYSKEANLDAPELTNREILQQDWSSQQESMSDEVSRGPFL